MPPIYQSSEGGITLFEVQTPEWIKMDLDTLFDDVENTEFIYDNINKIRDLESKIEMGLDLLVILTRSNSVNKMDKIMYEAYIQCKRTELSNIRKELASITGIRV